MVMTKPAGKLKPLSWSSFGISDVGKVRKLNEDSFLDRCEIGLWVVADGMGGHSAGDVASKMIVSSLKKIHEGLDLNRFVESIEEKIIAVNKKLFDMAQQSETPLTIGSTVVAMLAYAKYCVYIWAGDSRLYRLRENEIRQMTTDHSQVEIYVEQGLISREEAAVHPHANMITRAVGADEVIFLDMDIQEMETGDRYLLCSDGLNKHLSDLELEEILVNEGDLGNTCKTLIDITLDRGAGDNVTAIIIDIE